MEPLLGEVKSKLGKPYEDLEFLLNCLSEVLIENNEPELARQIPWISTEKPKFDNESTQKLLHLFSISFQLLNLSEVNGAVQNRFSEIGKSQTSSFHFQGNRGTPSE